MFPRPLVLLQCSIHNGVEELLIDDIFTQLLVLSVSYLPRSQILPSVIHPAVSFTEFFILWQKRGQGGMWRIYAFWRDGLGTLHVSTGCDRMTR